MKIYITRPIKKAPYFSDYIYPYIGPADAKNDCLNKGEIYIKLPFKIKVKHDLGGEIKTDEINLDFLEYVNLQKNGTIIKSE